MLDERLEKIKRDTFLTDPNTKVTIAEGIANGEIKKPEDLVSHYGITYYQAITLLNDPIVIDTMTKITQAKVNLAYNTVVVERVLNVLTTSDDNKEILSAAKMIGSMSGNMKGGSGQEVNVNLSLEGLVKGTNTPSGNEELDKMFSTPVIDIR